MEDAPQIGQIGKAAFLNDRHTMMKTGDDYDYEQAAQEPFFYWLSVPHRVRCIKAVDDSGRILGYVCWGFQGYSRDTIPTLSVRGLPSKDGEPKKIPGPALQTTKISGSEATGTAKNKPVEQEFTINDDKIKQLESITSADMTS
jgi:hypothetical protein